MKKLIFIISLSVFSFTQTEAQYSRTQNAADISELKAENELLEAEVKGLKYQFETVQANVDSLAQANADTPVKVPTTVAEAEDLLAWGLSLVMFILTGFIDRDKLPSWLSPFVLSIIIGIVISAVAYFASGGEFTIGEIVTFLLAISGGSNAIHQIKKPKKIEVLHPIKVKTVSGQNESV